MNTKDHKGEYHPNDSFVEIKKNILHIIEAANNINQKLSALKIYDLEVSEIIKKSMNVYLSSIKATANVDDAVKTLPADDFISLAVIIKSLEAYLNAERSGDDLTFEMPENSEYIFLTIDHKYFFRAMESFLRYLLKLAGNKKRIQFTIEENYNQTLLLVVNLKQFSHHVDETQFYALDFFHEVMQLHGIDCTLRTLREEPATVLRIPAYRIYIAEKPMDKK